MTTGFLAGIAVHIAAGQLPTLLGVPDSSGTLAARALGLLAESTVNAVVSKRCQAPADAMDPAGVPT